MQVKFIGDEDYVFCYGERGQKSPDRSSILLIHGFTSSKDQWNSAFKVKIFVFSLTVSKHQALWSLGDYYMLQKNKQKNGGEKGGGAERAQAGKDPLNLPPKSSHMGKMLHIV